MVSLMVVDQMAAVKNSGIVISIPPDPTPESGVCVLFISISAKELMDD